MIQWRDEGILLSVRKHPENSVIAEISVSVLETDAGSELLD